MNSRMVKNRCTAIITAVVLSSVGIFTAGCGQTETESSEEKVEEDASSEKVETSTSSSEEVIAESEETKLAEVMTDAEVSDLVGTWELDHVLDPHNKMMTKEEAEDMMGTISYSFDADGNACMTSATTDTPVYMTYTLQGGTVDLTVDTEEMPETLTLLQDGSLEVQEEDLKSRFFLLRTSEEPNFTPPVEDEFTSYANSLPGTYAVLGTTSTDNQIMPLLAISNAQLTDEGYAELEAEYAESLTLTKDETYTLVDFDGSTSSGNFTVEDGSVCLNGTPKFTINDDGSLLETADDTTLVLVLADLVDSKTEEIMGGSEASTSNEETQSNTSETVSIDGMDYAVGDTIEGSDLILGVEVATEEDNSPYYGYLTNVDTQDEYCKVIFANGLSDIDCDMPESLSVGTQLYVTQCYITGIQGYDESGIPVITGQLIGAHVAGTVLGG